MLYSYAFSSDLRYGGLMASVLCFFQILGIQILPVLSTATPTKVLSQSALISRIFYLFYKTFL